MADKFRVMIVDDNADLLETFKDILEFKGFEVATALSGPAAIGQARKQHFDAIILDLVMPGMSGADALVELKKLDPKAKFIIITAYVTSNQVAEVKKGGALRIFHKPFAMDEIVDFLVKLSKETQEPT